MLAGQGMVHVIMGGNTGTIPDLQCFSMSGESAWELSNLPALPLGSGSA